MIVVGVFCCSCFVIHIIYAILICTQWSAQYCKTKRQIKTFYNIILNWEVYCRSVLLMIMLYMDVLKSQVTVEFLLNQVTATTSNSFALLLFMFSSLKFSKKKTQN